MRNYRLKPWRHNIGKPSHGHVRFAKSI
jgi:hypothetical protein